MVGARFGLVAAALAAVVGAASAARAQPSGQDLATAQALFDEGKRLMAAGKHAEACPKLVESQRIDPGGGTLFAIALCHEGEGKTATAWADFNVALAEARKDHRADREAAAAERVRALEPKLTRLRIVPAARSAGLEIKRDGTRIGEAQWGTPLPIDPGEHTFEATGSGKKPWRQVVDVRGEGSTVDVAIPALEDAVIAPAPPPPPPQQPAPVSLPPDDGSQRTWGIAIGGVGLVATAVGLGFGLSASSKWSEAEKACQSHVCTDPDKKKLGDDAGTAADISTALVMAGGVGIVAGAVLWLTAPSTGDPKRGLRVVPTATAQSLGVSVGGTL
jgi:hypothetical protein